jgi:HSP20 family protein
LPRRKENLIKSTVSAAPAEESFPSVVKPERFKDLMRDLNQLISLRAYELFTVRGKDHGRDLEDWLRAEAELLPSLPLEILNSDDKVIVKAEVPGFKANELEIAAEPFRLILSGRTERTVDRKSGGEFRSESGAAEIFRALELPAEVDPDRASARLRNTVLEVTLVKVSGNQPRQDVDHA